MKFSTVLIAACLPSITNAYIRGGVGAGNGRLLGIIAASASADDTTPECCSKSAKSVKAEGDHGQDELSMESKSTKSKAFGYITEAKSGKSTKLGNGAYKKGKSAKDYVPEFDGEEDSMEGKSGKKSKSWQKSEKAGSDDNDDSSMMEGKSGKQSVEGKSGKSAKFNLKSEIAGSDDNDDVSMEYKSGKSTKSVGVESKSTKSEKSRVMGFGEYLMEKSGKSTKMAKAAKGGEKLKKAAKSRVL